VETKPISILIVEDEPIIAMDIESSLETMGYQIAGVIGDGRKAIEMARQLKPTLVLMDIQLEGALNGIETAKIIYMETGTPIIFVTSQTDKNTIAEALTAKPYGYIVKPFEEAELFANIELAMLKTKTEQRNQYNIQQPIEQDFFVKEDQKIIKLKYADIVYLESLENYVNIYTKKDKTVIRSTFSNVESNLPADLFIRIHRSFIVRLAAITCIHQDMITLDNGALIPLSKSYKDELAKKIQVLNFPQGI
jgi:DNA-binding LytR/AlgR family response regulator